MKWKIHGQMVHRNDPFIKDSPSVSYPKGGSETVETPLEKSNSSYYGTSSLCNSVRNLTEQNELLENAQAVAMD